VTGTGKTHTMRGGLKLAERGVIPRLLSGVFRRAKKITKDSGGNTTVTVALSYYEIYNDKVFDLLEPPEKRTPSGLPLRAEANGKTVVAGLSERSIEDLKDFEKLYIEANNNRVTAATKLNAHSSRSHAILKVKITQTTEDYVRESIASCCDLAGSEDNRRTENGKERLVESAAINKSLFVLSQCIDAISRGDRRIPFRESKMTRILSLGQNNGITIMILNLAPLRSYHLDTLSSLNVSSRAKRIEVREIENEVVFKQVPRAKPTTSGMAMARQPLRLLANAHNVHTGTMAAAAAEKEKAPIDRPAKAFNVYTDRAKTVPAVSNVSVKRTSSPQKRNSAIESMVAKPAKPVRPSQIALPSKIARPKTVEDSTLQVETVADKPPSQEISAALIEALVEKKVAEILASREQATVDGPQDKGGHDVKRRLEALERRIDDGLDDARSEGIRLLLMARQHKEKGELSDALKMYELALPFYPGKAKLISKIERLKARIEGKAQTTDAGETSHSDLNKAERRKKAHKREDDDSFDAEEADDDDDSFMHHERKRNKRSKAIKTAQPAMDMDGTPQMQQLFDVINSRETSTIMGLQGFGPKKARDLVQHLELLDMEIGSSGGRIESLAQLRSVPGMGGRAIERAYEGLLSAAV
jgi:hypothetical protein